jgi:hypothetical protein
MNYARGFKRLYAVAAACWIAFFLWAASTQPGSESNLMVIVAFAVPAATYVLFFMIFPWIGRGFRS